MGYYLLLHGIKWYYRLKPQKDSNGRLKKGLFSDTPRHVLANALVVSFTYYDVVNNKTLRLYSHFKSYLEYGIYQFKLPQHERCFYEIILGESTQKPHFDVDIDNVIINGEDVKNNLIDGIITVLENIGIEINLTTDILVYTSHGSNKQSYHIVVNNHCHANNVEAKGFYHKVVDMMKPEFVQWVDKAVYSPTQQFRIVGSTKIGSERVKTFQKSWKYHDQEITFNYPEKPEDDNHEFVMQLEASIVGYTGNCKFLPPFQPRLDQINHYDNDVDDVTQQEADEAINLIGLAGNISIKDPRFPYKFLGINGPIVMLKRIKPSRCKICCRVHEHENPYLLVIGEERSVYFHCRRAPEEKKLYLGKLDPNPESPEVKNSGEPSPEQIKISQMKINWTKNVIDKVQKLARTGKEDSKKFVTGTTRIDPNHKQQFIQMYISSE